MAAVEGVVVVVECSWTPKKYQKNYQNASQMEAKMLLKCFRKHSWKFNAKIMLKLCQNGAQKPPQNRPNPFHTRLKNALAPLYLQSSILSTPHAVSAPQPFSKKL